MLCWLTSTGLSVSGHLAGDAPRHEIGPADIEPREPAEPSGEDDAPAVPRPEEAGGLRLPVPRTSSEGDDDIARHRGVPDDEEATHAGQDGLAEHHEEHDEDEDNEGDAPQRDGSPPEETQDRLPDGMGMVQGKGPELGTPGLASIRCVRIGLGVTSRPSAGWPPTPSPSRRR